MAVATSDRSGEINFNFAGSGSRTIVWAGAAHSARFQEDLSRVGKVLTFDPRGTGKSFSPDDFDSYTMAAYSSDIHNLARHVGAEKPVLMGYSNSGYFATHYAVSHPENVSALILIEPALFVDKNWLYERVALARKGDVDGAINLLLRQIAPELSLDREKHASMVESIKAQYNNPAGLAGEWTARINHEFDEQQLQRLCMPVLIIGGADSQVQSKTMKAARMIPHASVWWVSGSGHLLIYDRPDQITAAVELFLQQQGL